MNTLVNFESALPSINGQFSVGVNTAVLLSNALGQYQVVRLGKPNWGSNIKLIRKKNNLVDIVFSGYAGGMQVFRFQNNNFIDVSSEYSGVIVNALGSPNLPLASSDITDSIVTSAYKQSPNPDKFIIDAFGITVYKIKNDGEYQLSSEYWIYADFTVDYITWTNSTSTIPVFTFGEKKYYGGGFVEFCLVSGISPGKNKIIVAKLETSDNPSNKIVKPGSVYFQSDFRNTTIYLFFELNDNILKFISSPIINEEYAATLRYGFQCNDINNDGYPDLVSYAFTRPYFGERIAEAGKPTIYLNNKNNKLLRIDLSNLPGLSSNSEKQSLLYDVDGDGIIDLILFGSQTGNGGGQIEIKLLSKPLNLP